MNRNYAELDRLRDRIVFVVKIDAVGGARFAAAERRVLAIASGKPGGADVVGELGRKDEVGELERKVELAFLESYREILSTSPDRLEPTPPMMFDQDRLVISFPANIERLGLLPALARAAASAHADSRVSVTRTWETRFPALGGHEHAVESADMGFEQLDECDDLARELAAAMRVTETHRRDLLDIIQALSSVYSTRIDGDGDYVNLHRLADGTQVSLRELEARARKLLG